MTRLPTLLDAEIAKAMQSRDPATRLDVAAQTVVPQDLAARLRDPIDRATKVPNEESRPQTDGREAELTRQAKARNALLDRLGLRRSSDGTLQLKDQMTLQQLPGLGSQRPARPGDARPGIETLAALPPPPVAEESVNPQALSAFSDALGRSMDDLLVQSNGQPTMIESLAMDSLTAVFMKLNIDNPLDTTEMQNQLEQALHEMRELQIQNVKKQLQEFDKMLKEAMASAMSGFFMAAIMAAIIAAIIAAILLGIIAAIIVAIIVMVVMMIVKQQIQAMIEKKAAEARKQAEQMAQKAIEQIDQGIEAERQRRMEEIAALSLVGPDGEPLTSESMRARLQPRLVEALMKITNILDTEGAAAAEAQGPGIIHDAMFSELLALGIPEDRADALAWAIAAETMTNLANKVGRKDDANEVGRNDDGTDDGVVNPTPLPGEAPGRHPGQTINPNSVTNSATDDGPPAGQVPVVDAGPPGRHPSEILGVGLGSLTAPPAETINPNNVPISATDDGPPAGIAPGIDENLETRPPGRNPSEMLGMGLSGQPVLSSENPERNLDETLNPNSVPINATNDIPPAGIAPGINENLETRPPGRHPSEMLGMGLDSLTALSNDVPSAGIAPVINESIDARPPGRNPSEMLGMGLDSPTALSESNEALAALLASTIVKEGERIAVHRVPAESIHRIGESLATRGIEATLRDEAMREKTIAPSTMLGMGAILYGSLPAELLAGDLKEDIDARQIIAQVATAKDRALEALLTVGNQSRTATEQIQRTTNV